MAKEAKNKEKKMKDNNKKGNKHFFKDVKAELKKVIWPTPKQLLANTVAVIVYALIVGIIVFALDICFEKINTFGVDKLKTTVKSSEENKEEINNSIDSTNNEVDSSTENSKESNANDAK